MSSPLPDLLKKSRARLGISQLEISLRLGVSQRHVSFIESGRAQPSRTLLLAWMRELQADDSLRNAALLHAGFAPGDLAGGRRTSGESLPALRQILAAHHPNAGLIFDADWRIVELNGGARWLFGMLMPELWRDAPSDGQIDMIASLEHPAGLLASVRDPGRVSRALLAHLRAEQWARPGLSPRVDRLAAILGQRFDLPVHAMANGTPLPYLDVSFDTPLGVLSFLLVQTVFGLPHDVTVGSLRIELWYPLDSLTTNILSGAAAPRLPVR